MIKQLITIIACLYLVSCTTAEAEDATSIQQESGCQPYFSFDEVDHYYCQISEEEVWDLEDKNKKSMKDELLLDVLTNFQFDQLEDTVLLNEIGEIGFLKTSIPQEKFSELEHIFCERVHPEAYALLCSPIYRDLLVFKLKGRIIGLAKICFDCDRSIICGTERNTSEFGQSGDYSKLYKLLH